MCVCVYVYVYIYIYIYVCVYILHYSNVDCAKLGVRAWFLVRREHVLAAHGTHTRHAHAHGTCTRLACPVPLVPCRERRAAGGLTRGHHTASTSADCACCTGRGRSYAWGSRDSGE